MDAQLCLAINKRLREICNCERSALSPLRRSRLLNWK